MRTIVAFSFLAALAAGQSSQIENLERGLVTKPDNPGARVQILQLLTDPNVNSGIPFERVIETRRRHILWLIEHHPEQSNNFLRATQLIPSRGTWADPEGYADSVRMWKERVSRANTSAEIIANVAIYLKATDRPAARAILNAALKDHPQDNALWRAVGMIDAASMAGITGVGDRDQFATDAALRNSPEAKAARQEIESSGNAFVPGGAAQVLSGNLIQNQAQLALGEDDADSLADRWLRRAIGIAPSAQEWKTMLAPVVRNQANRAEDPRERARLFAEAMGFAPENQKPTFLPDLAKAEFEAGDDQAAGRDARRAVEAAPELVKRNPGQSMIMINRGNAVLGRIALAQGDAAEARSRLHASLAPPADLPKIPDFGYNGPDMTLAQDLAEAGERDAVIEYLETSRPFWPYDRGLIDRYIRAIKAGRKREAFANYPHSSSEIVNRPAPNFKLHEVDGKEWTLASIAGKPAALFFWNVACQSCATQIADFAKAASATGMRVVAVNVGDSDAAVQAFLEKHPLTVTVLEGGAGALALAYRADTFPSVAMIDTSGRLVQYQVGATANPRQILESATRPRVETPVPIGTGGGEERKITFSWKPVPGAQSYVVEWEQKDSQGWPSDRDGFLSVIPTKETAVTVDCARAFRWRVYAVGTGGRSEPTGWLLGSRADLR